MTGPLEVLLDVNVLGRGFAAEATRTGIFRASEGVLGAMLFGLIVWGSYEPALHAWSSGEFEGEGALRIPVWPARFVVMLGSLLVAITYVAQAINAAIAMFGTPDASAVPQPRRMGH